MANGIISGLAHCWAALILVLEAGNLLYAVSFLPPFQGFEPGKGGKKGCRFHQG
jgi:hypothetical protein